MYYCKQNFLSGSLREVSNYNATIRTGAPGRRVSNNNVFWKQKILKFFCKRTNKIQGFKNATVEKKTVWTYLTSLETTLKFMNVIGPFAKKPWVSFREVAL